MRNSGSHSQVGQTLHFTGHQIMSIGETITESGHTTMGKRSGKRPGRKPSKIDERAKLERSRQSARECRARKKLRYQYLEELVLNREKAVFALRDELEIYKRWCLELDNGESVPDSLLKVIANEDIAQQKKQMEQANRSLLQQRQEHEFQLSSTSSSSSESSPPPPQQEHSQTSEHKSSVARPLHQPSMLSQPSSSSLVHHYQPDISHHLRQQKQEQLFQLLQQSASTTRLQRQMTHERSQTAGIQPGPKQEPHKLAPKIASSLQSYSQSSDPKLITLTQFEQHKQRQKLQQQLRQHHLREQGMETTSSAQQPFSLSHQLSHRSQIPSRTRMKSEMLKGFSKVGMHSPLHDTRIGVQDKTETRRGRSLSNPVSMISFLRPSTYVTSTETLPSSSQVVATSQKTRTSSDHQSDHSCGQFTDSFIRSSTPSVALNIPASLKFEESSSSDENITDKQLFQSSSLSQKRTLSDSFLPEDPKRRMASTGMWTSASSASGYDPKAELRDLTTVHCFSTTRTFNTPSPSSSGLGLSGSLSPTLNTKYSKTSSSTPCSSATASPAPPSSLSSLLELSISSPGMSFCTFETPIEDPSTSRHSIRPSTPATIPCSATGLSASINEPIPELYSFLADLEDGGMSTLTSRHGASSCHSTPMASTPKQQDQPSTPDPSFMNVPKIIDDFLKSDDQD